jgi:hypothetical protein
VLIEGETGLPDSTLHILEPWTMPYLEMADVFINALYKRIGPKHVLYRRDVFPVALRRDPDAVIYETDDEPRIYALVFLSWSPGPIKRRGRADDPRTVILSDRKAVQARMDDDNAELLTKFR